MSSSKDVSDDTHDISLPLSVKAVCFRRGGTAAHNRALPGQVDQLGIGGITPAWMSQPSQSPKCQTSVTLPSVQWKTITPLASVRFPVGGTVNIGDCPL